MLDASKTPSMRSPRFESWRIGRGAILTIATISILASGCTVELLSFRTPSSVLAGSAFDIVVTGRASLASTGAPGDGAGAVLQLPNGFVVESAVAGFGALIALTRDDSSLIGMYAAEPGHYLASFSGIASPSPAPAALRVRVRAPTLPGTFTVKVALAGMQNGVWSTNVPIGATNFAAITAATVVRSIAVVVDAASAPTWQLDSDGITVNAGQSLQPPFDLDIADFDLDGLPDLLAGSTGDPTEPLLYRRRCLEGYIPASPPFGAVSSRARFGDFDADGRPDVVVGRTVRYGDGLGGFTVGAVLAPPPAVLASPALLAPGQTAIAVGDLNDDSFDDIVVSEGQVEVFLSLGNGQFTHASQGLPTGLTMSSVSDIELSDIDQDNDLDILGAGTPQLEIFRNDGAAGWTALFAGGTNLSGGAGLFDVAAADLNGDSLPELLVTGAFGGVNGINGFGMSLYVNLGGGLWMSQVATGLPAIGRYAAATFGDIDGDGLLDVVAAAPSFQFNAPPPIFGAVRIWRGIQGMTFASAPALESGLSPEGHFIVPRLVLKDADGDGRDDIAVATNVGPSVFARVGPMQTARFGNVGASVAGGPFPVLTVNGSPGDPASRAVAIGLGQPITIGIAQSPTLALPSRFAIWGAIGLPDASDAFPSLIGAFLFTPHLVDPALPGLFTVANAYHPSDPLALVQGTLPGPFQSTAPVGIQAPFRFAFEGIIDDPSAPNGIARTNTVVVDIR